MLLDGVELGVGAFEALGRIEQGVDLLAWHTVAEQGELQIDLRLAAQAAAAGELLQVEELLGGGRPLAVETQGVVRHDGGEEEHGAAAVGDGAGRIVVGRWRAVGRWRQVVHWKQFEQAFVAAEQQIHGVEIHDIPMHVAGLDLRTHLRQAAVVVRQPHFDAVLLGEGVEHGELAGAGVGAAPGGHGKHLGSENGRRRKDGRAQGQRSRGQLGAPGRGHPSSPPDAAHHQRASQAAKRSFTSSARSAHHWPSVTRAPARCSSLVGMCGIMSMPVSKWVVTSAEAELRAGL